MNLEQLIAVADETPKVMGKAEVVKQNLQVQHEKVSADNLKRILRIKNRELFFMLKKEKEVDLFIIYLLCY